MRESLHELREQLEAIIVGQSSVVEQVLVGLLAGGHVLLEGVPGVGKTRLAKALTHLIGGVYQRVQFTPDLLPSDILGNVIFDAGGQFEIREGPIFANVFLADEINRTPPKTQAALLEAMEERQVSIFGQTRELPQPFFVIATQNPIEYEGTYPLPEAQLDRFIMRIQVSYPDEAAEVAILRQHKSEFGAQLARLSPVLTPRELAEMIREVGQLTVADSVLEYIAKLVRTSRTMPELSLGASPRAATALLDCARAVAYLADRTYVIPDDVLAVVHPVLRHRLILNPNAELEGVDPDGVIDRLVETVEVPR
jgi:MoxR-like ATPase